MLPQQLFRPWGVGLVFSFILGSSGCVGKKPTNLTADSQTTPTKRQDFGRLLKSGVQLRSGVGNHKFHDRPAASFTLEGRGESRIRLDARSLSEHARPLVALLRDGTVVDASFAKTGQTTYLDIVLPFTGTYQVVVALSRPDAEFELTYSLDQHLPASRAGDYYLAHADAYHAWFVDRSSLKRDGDIARFVFEEKKTAYQTYKGTQIHTYRWETELNCRTEQIHSGNIALRQVDESGRHRLQRATFHSWAPVKEYRHLMPFVCQATPPVGTLRWPDLDLAINAVASARKLGNQNTVTEDPSKAPRETLSPRNLGDVIKGTLAPRASGDVSEWAFHRYSVPIQPDDRFALHVRFAKFRPFLRIREGNRVLVTSYDTMTSGVFGPIGDDLLATKPTVMTIELTSLESVVDGNYEIELRRLPPTPVEPNLAVVEVSRLESRVMQLSREKYKQEVASIQAEVDAEIAAISQARADGENVDELLKRRKALEARVAVERERLGKKHADAEQDYYRQAQLLLIEITKRDGLKLLNPNDSTPRQRAAARDLTDEVLRRLELSPSR